MAAKEKYPVPTSILMNCAHIKNGWCLDCVAEYLGKKHPPKRKTGKVIFQTSDHYLSRPRKFPETYNPEGTSGTRRSYFEGHSDQWIFEADLKGKKDKPVKMTVYRGSSGWDIPLTVKRIMVRDLSMCLAMMPKEAHDQVTRNFHRELGGRSVTPASLETLCEILIDIREKKSAEGMIQRLVSAFDSIYVILDAKGKQHSGFMPGETNWLNACVKATLREPPTMTSDEIMEILQLKI
jgi:hypothetical protein